jgi:amidase
MRRMSRQRQCQALPLDGEVTVRDDAHDAFADGHRSSGSRAPDLVDPNEYIGYDALGLAELVRTRTVTPRELVDAAIARIERLNPQLNAVVLPMFDSARAAASLGPAGGPFAGVPFLIKDLLTSFAGTPTSCGSRLFRGYVAPHDSEVAARYRRSGVIVVGKTNTPEFGLTPFTEGEALGIARNPWNPARTTGGSSGGSAAAVASGMVPMAGGGDGGGSIRVPASCCGLFGLKPTRGRVPTGPDEGELWGGAVTEGVISRSVRDSAAMLDAIAGADVGAPYVIPAPQRPYLSEMGVPPGRLRIAFSDAPMLGHEIHPDCQAALRDAVGLLESLGHELVEGAPPVDRDAFNRAFLTIICGEVLADFRDAEARLGRRVTRQDVEYTTWGLSLLGRGISAGEFALAMRYLQRSARTAGAFFEGVDLLVTPTLGGPPFAHGALQPKKGEERMLRAFGALRAGGLMKRLGALEQAAATVFDWIPYAPLFNVTGQPAMSVPLFWNAEGLPIGIQIAGRFGDESTLFRIATQLEEARPWRDRWPAMARDPK